MPGLRPIPAVPCATPVGRLSARSTRSLSVPLWKECATLALASRIGGPQGHWFETRLRAARRHRGRLSVQASCAPRYRVERENARARISRRKRPAHASNADQIQAVEPLNSSAPIAPRSFSGRGWGASVERRRQRILLAMANLLLSARLSTALFGVVRRGLCWRRMPLPIASDALREGQSAHRS